jgi:hypothetical protein
MRVGCSPFYPAEPRALVGSDVLNLLPEPERSGRTGQVVRQFFDTTDASQFSVTGPNPVGLLDLQPELEAVLQNLEQKLRA